MITHKVPSTAKALLRGTKSLRCKYPPHHVCDIDSVYFICHVGTDDRATDLFKGITPMHPTQVTLRLRLLANRLARVRRGFDMRFWGVLPSKPGQSKPPAPLKVVGAAGHVCATAACALGWATTIPELELALLHREGSEWATPVSTRYRCMGQVIGGNFAAVLAFGIAWGEAESLFLPRDTDTVTKGTVIRRIRALAKKYEKLSGSPA